MGSIWLNLLSTHCTPIIKPVIPIFSPVSICGYFWQPCNCFLAAIRFLWQPSQQQLMFPGIQEMSHFGKVKNEFLRTPEPYSLYVWCTDIHFWSHWDILGTPETRSKICQCLALNPDLLATSYECWEYVVQLISLTDIMFWCHVNVREKHSLTSCIRACSKQCCKAWCPRTSLGHQKLTF